MWSLSSILIIHDTNGINTSTTLANNSDDSGIIVLESPFHIEYYQNVVRNQKYQTRVLWGLLLLKESSTGH